jgi:hypothetical protein
MGGNHEGGKWMKEIICIDIVLENCEIITVKVEDLNYFQMPNITRSIGKPNYHKTISNTLRAEGLFLAISLDANYHDSFKCTWHNGKVTPFDRLLEHKDIVSVDIIYADGTNEYIYAPWGGDSDYVNEYQTLKTHKETGDLYIAVSKKEKVDSYFEFYLK